MREYHGSRSPISTKNGIDSVVYRFSIQIGTIPLTGTTDRTHMLEALDAASFELSEDEIRLIETIEG